MDKGPLARRDVLKGTAAAGAMGLGAAAHAAGVPAYDPNARFDLVVGDVELRRNSAGRMLMARIYQPKGPGPFPTVLDLHGGAWNRKDRFAEEPMDRALAASGLLVVAVANRDLAVVQCILLLVAMTMVTSNLIVDFLYGFLDPRLRTKGAHA